MYHDVVSNILVYVARRRAKLARDSRLNMCLFRYFKGSEYLAAQRLRFGQWSCPAFWWDTIQ